MRIFRGLENIHSVIDRHEAEWRREQGEEPERPDALSLEEAVRRRIAARPETGSGKFSADRFLGVKHDSPKPEAPIPEPEPAPNEPDSSAIPETESATHEPESDIAPELDAIPDVIEVIPPKEGRHSWLYNEVLKAVNDAAQDRNNTKIISVFVPVVQDGGEFEDLPADGVLNISPVNENATHPAPEIEATEIIRHKDGKHSRLYDEVMRAITDAAENGKFSKVVAVFVPVVQSKSEFEDMPFDEAMTASPVSEDFANVESFSPEAPVNESDAQESESPVSVETLPEISESPEAETLAVMSEALPEIAESLEVADMAEPVSPANDETLPEIIEAPEIEASFEPETLPEISDMAEIESPATELEIPEEMPALESPEEFDLLPETKPDAELAEAFREMEEKLDEDIQQEEQQTDFEIESDIEPITAQESESPLTDDEPEMIIPPEESHDEPEIITAENDDEFSDLGIPMDTGEAMRFEDIDAEEQPAEILLPGELDDDEVFDEPTFDESFTEVHRPDDDTEPEIIIEESDAFPDDDEDDEIEILPDPVKL